MSFIPCSVCGRRNVGYLAHTYWFAPRSTDDALRLRQRLCPDCLQERVTSWLSPEDAESLTCPACGISVEDEVFAVYVTWYPSKGEAARGAMSLCEQHFVVCCNGFTEGATPLPDRFLELADEPAAAPRPTGDEVIRSMGRVPRPLTPNQRANVARMTDATLRRDS